MLNQGVDEPAFIMLLADALKPRRGEGVADLRMRLASTVAGVPRGEDALIALSSRDPLRERRYRGLRWRADVLPLARIRVWPGMDGLPKSWCEQSVEQTADFVRANGLPRADSRLSKMLALRDRMSPDELVDWLTYLPLPVLADDLLHNRPPCPGVPWALDDGCARAVTLSLLGVASVAVVLGEPVE